jgi:hypothetical protein
MLIHKENKTRIFINEIFAANETNYKVQNCNFRYAGSRDGKTLFESRLGKKLVLATLSQKLNWTWCCTTIKPLWKVKEGVSSSKASPSQ